MRCPHRWHGTRDASLVAQRVDRDCDNTYKYDLLPCILAKVSNMQEDLLALFNINSKTPTSSLSVVTASKMASNKAAWLTKAGTPLEVGEAPLPTAGPREIVVHNAAVAINPLDCHMQDAGVFITQWPAVFGCDVAGEVHEVGSDVGERFKVGDRVIGYDHTSTLRAKLRDSLIQEL